MFPTMAPVEYVFSPCGAVWNELSLNYKDHILRLDKGVCEQQSPDCSIRVWESHVESND